MKPTNYHKSYTDDQIRVILLTPATAQNRRYLAGAFGRTIGAIDLVRRHAGYARPPKTMKGTQTFLLQCIRIRKELGLPSSR
jgi:hypothetical protein